MIKVKRYSQKENRDADNKKEGNNNEVRNDLFFSLKVDLI